MGGKEMRRIILTALIFLACISCSKRLDESGLASQEPVESSFGTSSLILIKTDKGNVIHDGPSSTITLSDGDEFKVWTYPNTHAPINVESSDSTILSVHMTGHNTFIVDCGNPGKAVISVSSEGCTKSYNITVKRTLMCDIVYNPTSDRIALRLTRCENPPIEDEFYTDMEISLHMIVRWTYKVGYSSSRMNTHHEVTEIKEGTFRVVEDIDLASLTIPYSRIKAEFDKELEHEKSLDPNHDWASWSGISCNVVIYSPNTFLTLSKTVTEDSVFKYNLGFTFGYSIL